MKNLVKIIAVTSILVMTNTYASFNAKPLVEKFVQPTSQAKAWSWQTLTALPKSEYDAAVPTFDEYLKAYTVSRSLKSSNNLISYSITGYGTKTAPTAIHLSSYTRGYDEEAKELFKLSDIVNTKEVSKLKSNCTLKDADFGNGKGEEEGAEQLNITQTIYKWSRANTRPLYIAEQQSDSVVLTGVFNHATTYDYLIAQYTVDLAKAMSQLKWNYNQKTKKVACSFN